METLYMEQALTGEYLQRTVSRLVEKIKEFGLFRFDAIAFRGMSGAIVASAVAAQLGKNLIMVRKDTTSAHSFYKVEGSKEDKNYIIIDDFITRGNTVRAIVKDINENLSQDSNLVAIFLYGDDSERNLFEINGQFVPRFNFDRNKMIEKLHD